MILLLGGAAETARIATALAEAGFHVLVSTATSTALDVGEHDRITRRSGPLDKPAMERLIKERCVKALVDATHPYADLAHDTAQVVADNLDLPYFRYDRPRSTDIGDSAIIVTSHDEAAEIACSFGRPVFVTSGAKNLEPYVREADATGVTLIARVLPVPESIQAALDAGCAKDRIITGRGPFSVEDNLAVIRDFNIGVLVTKDGGKAGGVPAKIDAAKRADCRLVVIARPKQRSGWVYESVSEVVSAVTGCLMK